MSNPPVPEGTVRWLALSEAAELLGVHPVTLRRWTDAGEIRCLRTPGGHRRFLREDLQAFLEAREQPGLTSAPETLTRSLVRQTHQEVVRSITTESWHAAFDEADCAARRDSGRRLLGLAIQYTLRTTGREPFLAEGRRIGEEYGQDAARRGLSLVDTVRAFFFFREALIRSARPGLSTRGQYDAEDVRIHRSLREFLDQVLFAVLAAYERTLQNLLAAGASA